VKKAFNRDTATLPCHVLAQFLNALHDTNSLIKYDKVMPPAKIQPRAIPFLSKHLSTKPTAIENMTINIGANSGWWLANKFISTESGTVYTAFQRHG
jgi:hypothetical protein